MWLQRKVSLHHTTKHYLKKGITNIAQIFVLIEIILAAHLLLTSKLVIFWKPRYKVVQI